jgi:cytochrome P450
MGAGDRKPPSPPLPPRMQALALRFAPHRFVQACRRRYGDVVMFCPGSEPAFLRVFDSELVMQVLRGVPARSGFEDAQLMIGERSLVMLEGAEHAHWRRELSPPLHGERMRAQIEVIRRATDRIIDSWRPGEAFTLLPSMRSLTLEVIAHVVLGPEERGSQRDELMRRVRALTSPPARRRRMRLARRRRMRQSAHVLRARRAVDELLRGEITQQRAAPERHDGVLSTLLRAGDEEGQPLTDQELCDQLVLLLVAGSVTTAPGLAWTFELLLQHPGVLERLQAELAAGDEDYLDAVIKETLRLRPPGISATRVVRGEPFALGGYLIPPDTEIRWSFATIHQAPEHHPEPLAFRPERFLGPGPPGPAWVPFGAGSHRCPGARFATFEMAIVIRRVLERTRLRPAARRAEKWLGMAPDPGVRVFWEPG